MVWQRLRLLEMSQLVLQHLLGLNLGPLRCSGLCVHFTDPDVEIVHEARRMERECSGAPDRTLRGSRPRIKTRSLERLTGLMRIQCWTRSGAACSETRLGSQPRTMAAGHAAARCGRERSERSEMRHLDYL